MEKNAILAAVLSLAVLLGWQYFFVPQEPPKKKDVSTKAPLQQKLSSRQKGSITDRAIRVSPKKSHAPKTENLNARKRSLPKNFKEILVKVDVGNAVYGLTNYGAGFVQMQLNDYKDEKGKFIDLAKGYYSDLKPLFFWGSGSGVLNRAFYKVYVNGQEVTESKTIKIGSKKGGQKVTFVLQGKAQEKVEKSLFFSAGSYRIPTTILIRNAKNLDALGVALGPSVGGSDGDTYGGVIEGPMSFVDKDIVYDNPESDNDQPKYDKNVKWTSLQSKYFITALVPRTGSGGAQINLLKANKDRANDYAAIVPLRSENSRVLATMEKYGLKRGENGLQVYIMCEVPSNVILAEQFSEHIDGFSIGSNDLTQLTLGLDRDSALVADLYDERNEAVKRSIKMLIKAAKKTNTKVGICGQGPSDFPDFAEFLVREGIDTISVTPDSLLKTLRIIEKVERDDVFVDTLK